MEERKCGEWKPVFAMVAVDVAFAIVNILIKKILDEGMNHLVLVTYRQAIATVFIAPIAFFRERKTRPKFTTRIFWHLFISAMIGATLTQCLFLLGIDYTSATFSCAFINLVPGVTFLMALPFGSETADMKSRAGRAKVFGTVVCVGGAMLLTFYEGMPLTNTSHPQAVGHPDQSNSSASNQRSHNWTLGSIALIGGCLSWSSWFLLQAKIGKVFPAPYSSTTVITLLSCGQAAILSLVVQRDISPWLLKGAFHIATVIFAGIMGSGLCYVVMSWCVEKRGPLFTAAFSPLIQIVVGVIDVTILHEQLHLGSVMGSFFVIIGLYILLWGKSLEAGSSFAKRVQRINGDECQLSEPA